MKNLKKELEEYCKSIEIEYPDKFTLYKSVNGIEYPFYPGNIYEIYLDNREEVLFVMLYLFCEGFYYYNTLSLADTMIYQDDSITSFYKYFSHLIYKFTKNICTEVSPFLNPNEFFEYKETESSFILTQILENICKLLIYRDNSLKLVNQIIKLIKKSHKTKFKPIEKGYSYLNSLHFTSNIVVTELNLPSINEILAKLEEDFELVKRALLSRNIFELLMNNVLEIFNLNILCKILLFNYFCDTHYKYFFCDFGIILQNLGTDSNIQYEFEKIRFFAKILTEKNIINDKKYLDIFISLYFEQYKKKLADFPKTNCYWTNKMYKIYKLI